MSKRRIHLLDEKTINQIAAGEVIENTASVIKELVENAIDAKATEISVETLAGGRGLISVADNGEGMTEDDLLLAFERHATSKIFRVDDLNSLTTLGFRGEALPSIAAISKLSIHTSVHSGEGTLMPIEGGRLGKLSSLPRRQGTTICVKSLFFNVPVRKHFQKSVAWDTGEVHKVLTRFALCYPSIAFSWINDGKKQFVLAANCHASERVAALLGEGFAEALLPVEHKKEHLELSGFIGNPLAHRPNRTGEYLFINQRTVFSSFVAKKVVEGYGTRLPPRRYPLFILHFSLPLHWVDVNVHPQKREVRLSKQELIGSFFEEAVESALEISEMPPISVQFSAEPLFFPNLAETSSLFASENLAEYQERPEESAELMLVEEKSLFEIKKRQKISILAKVGRYFFIQENHGIRLVDIHRALEQIVYQELEAAKDVQNLLFPIQLTFSGKEKFLLMEKMEELNVLGISIRHFGGESFIVDAIPAVLEESEVPDLIEAFLDEGSLPKKIGRCLKRSEISLEAGEWILEKLFHERRSEYTPNGELIHTLLSENKIMKFFKPGLCEKPLVECEKGR